MQWTDRSIILSSRKFSETSAVIKLFSREHGVYGGMVRGASGKAARGIYQPGNIVEATWSARLSEHLGSLRAELVRPVAALVMQDAFQLSALSATCSLLAWALHERESHPTLFDRFETVLTRMAEDEDFLIDYVLLELEILSFCGFGIDLSRCAATGQLHDLSYVSPKSGRAVCKEAGEPYHEKMLPLPAFLLPNARNPAALPQEIIDGLRLTGYFLESRLAASHGKSLPAARERWIKLIHSKTEKHSAHGLAEAG